MNSFLFRLPQTIVRAFGLDSIIIKNFLQAPVRLNNGNKKTDQAIYQLNEDLIYSVFDESPQKVMENKSNFESNFSPMILESNLINIYHLYLQQINKLFLMPYASFVYNPKLSDLFYVKNFIKCLRDCNHYRKLISIQGVFDWASMVLKEEKSDYLPWFWDAIKLDQRKYNYRLTRANQYLKAKSELINLIAESENPIIVQIILDSHLNSYRKVLEYFYQNNLHFQNLLNKQSATIFIKQRRSDIEYNSKSSDENFLGNKIIIPKNLYDHFIPTEILLASNIRSFLVSEISSTVFNNLIANKIIVSTSRSSKMFMQQGLMAQRFTKLQ
jgi:hypothetical protein